MNATRGICAVVFPTKYIPRFLAGFPDVPSSAMNTVPEISPVFTKPVVLGRLKLTDTIFESETVAGVEPVNPLGT